MDLNSSHAQAHAAFESVISLYQERQQGGLQALNTGSTTVFDAQKPTARGVPSTSDFLCDVELSARKVLNEAEHGHFCDSYRSCTVLIGGEGRNSLEFKIRHTRESVQTIVAGWDHSVRTKLGQHFMRVGMCPLAQYAAPTGAHG